MNIKNFLKKGLIACFMFSVLMAGFSYSQESTGKIVGTVTDEEGVPLPGVAVDISSPSLMGIRADVTTDKGLYRFINLPPGIYKMVFSLEGFTGVERPNVRVRVGGTTTVDATLKMTTLEEEVIVIAEAPVIDVEKSGLHSTFTTADFEKLPLPQTMWGIRDSLNFYPGLQVERFAQSSFGSASNDNNFTINGLQVSSPEAGTLRMPPDIQMVEEVEMITAGAPAEYGQMTGAVVNIVTKSGGNKFQGMLHLYVQPDFLSGDNNPDPDRWQSLEYRRWYDASFSLSGSVAKDKIWFFVYGNRNSNKVIPWAGDPDYPSEINKYIGEIKVTAQIGTRHKVTGNLMHLYDHERSSVPGPYVMLESAASMYTSRPGFFANWDWQLSRNALYSMKIGYWCNPEYEFTMTHGGTLKKAPHFDEVTGILSGSVDGFLYWNNARFQWNNSVSYYAEDFLGTPHDFKVGVQFSRGISHPAGGYPGNAYYYDQNNQPYLMNHRYPHHYGGYNTSIGGFVDDTVKVGDRLTLNVGIRFDNTNCDIPEWPLMDGPEDIPGTAAPGAENIIVWSTISPRLGFTYQLTADRKTILKAHWGLYHPRAHGSNFGAPGPGKRDLYKYEYTGPPTTVFPYATNPFDDPDNWVEYDFIKGSAGYTMDPDIKSPVSSQFTAGIEHELLPDFSIGITYVYKKDWNLIGLEDRGATYEEVERVSPDNGKTYTVWNMTSDPGTHDIWQINPEEYGLNYNSVILVFDKRYSNNWMLKASLQWQSAEGLNVGFKGGMGQTVWGNDYGQDPNDWINAKGPLPFVREWLYKMQMSYSFPYGFSIGLNYIFRRGQLHRAEVRIPDLNQGMRYIVDQPLGDRRLDDEHNLNIRFEKRFTFDTIGLCLIADISNVFNTAITSRIRSYWIMSDVFMDFRRLNYARKIQLGVRLTF